MTSDKAEEVSDATLVCRAKAGELDAFEELVRRHERPVYSVAWRILQNSHDAEDITQQSFLNALEHLGEFRGDAAFGTWIQRIAMFAALKVLRKRRGLEMTSLEQATESSEGSEGVAHPEYIADWRQSPEHLAQQNETQRLIDEALAQLDEKHRVVFVLRDVEGLSVKETAEALGLSESNVKVRLLRARLQLRELLTRAFGDPERRLEPAPHHHE